MAGTENERIQVVRTSGEHVRTFSDLVMSADFALSRAGEVTIISPAPDDFHRAELQIRSVIDGSVLRSVCIDKPSTPISMCTSATGEHVYITDWQLHACIRYDCSTGARTVFAGGRGAGVQDG